ncbi:MAG: NAD-dependent deacylase [Deltaproteobacteria bacterium]|nr:NAD-dependent deacylase [Deltaproteobacteria bacterium]MBW2161756.1 NAD-dependent deacylase [Deltaproteobacteria bacterium]MBW2589047.1 NAD-dependent deacylase [Deltaproteobacteria bacterium]
MVEEQSISEIVRRLRDSRSVLFVTGAGISADSGLPTYRGIGGLYEQEETDDGVPIEAALSGAMFERDPAITWKYIHQIESSCRNAGPNRAHEVIAELEGRFDRVWTLTQNVDGLHHAAGSKQVIDIHGDVHRLLCTRCGHRWRVTSYAGLDIPPSCPECASLVRPEVVLFGEMLPLDRTKLLQEQLARGFDAVFSIGTTSVFPYIAEPVVDARRRGALTVEVNPGTSEVSHIVDHRLRIGAAAAMDAIVRELDQF